MRNWTYLGIGVGIAMSCTAWAGDAVDPAALGAIDAMLATCHEVNPGAKAEYDLLREAMIGEQPEGDLAALVQTPEYQQAYDESRKQTEAESRDSVLKDCARLSAAFGPRIHHDSTPDKSKQKK